MKKEKSIEPVVLYRDERQIQELQRSIRGCFSLAKRMSDLWNSMSLLPPMTRQIMKELAVVGAVGFEDMIWRFIQEETTRVHGARYAAGMNRRATDLTEYFDPVRATGILNALVVQNDRFHGLFHTDHIEYDSDGEPFISAETIRSFESRYEIYATPDNKRKWEIFHNAETAINELQELLNEHRLPSDALTFVRGKGLTVTLPLMTFGKPQ